MNDPDQLFASIVDGLPVLLLVVGPDLRVVHANAAATRQLGAKAGGALRDAFGCVEGGDGRCVHGARCAGCAFRRVAERAVAGEPGRARAFVQRTGASGEPADLHLLLLATPLDRAGGPHAVLVLADVDPILADPGVVHVCAGCGRVEDEGDWHGLHRYLEDRLGLEVAGELCGDCGQASGERRAR